MLPDILIFLSAAVVIGYVGTKMTYQADVLADLTGWGEAFIGAVFLGASTSLPGITASVVAAADGRPTLALSNALGGIAAQTLFLAAADSAYRKINLEHAAASVENLLQGTLLISLLAMLMFAMVGPDISFLGVNPITPLLFIAYFFGLKLIRQSHKNPMWVPRETKETKLDTPDDENKDQSLKKVWIKFIVGAAIIIAAGWFLVKAAEGLADKTGINESLIGGLLVAITTSLPELVTSIAAVRRGALTLAVGGILGGNAFDTLFAAVADISYREGSIYHAASKSETLLIAVTVLMTSILIMGLIKRQKKGIANIGFESFLIVVVYIAGFLTINFLI